MRARTGPVALKSSGGTGLSLGLTTSFQLGSVVGGLQLVGSPVVAQLVADSTPVSGQVFALFAELFHSGEVDRGGLRRIGSRAG